MSTNRLGRGLGALFQEHDIESIESFEQVKEGEVVQQLDVKTLRPNPYQPRKYFDETKINELALSIKEHGVFQPIIVKKDIKGYIIIAGERRFRAAQKANLQTIPAIVREFNDHLMMEYALIENLQREDLTAIEEAEAYKMLMQKLDLTQERLAERIGKSRAYIANTMRLLQLPRVVQDDIENNIISVGHGKVLAGLKDEDLIIKFANVIKEKQISVRELEDLIKEASINQPEIEKKVTKVLNPHLDYVKTNLESYFGTKVKIKEKQGKGQIIINYNDLDNLNHLLEIMGIEL
ncbi:MAG: ParB/RepB/Spo0J family partition protein [Turicibacter sanguinis]|uniref:ParB/RepB/Spo0J family partition protein n=1 Tax=Turicibacter TaxID=191303 RepID=UPI0001FD99E8|nr:MULTISPECIES: ParB/RepB/Spo0J family partition protein [Turicibacter]EGC92914.1 stage 0 sporulation protein J [Turicibacter sp. HGF1]MCU7201553.1 ParB/RepB/Spo0J family partition protein [Turicibacter sanguinis]MDB8566811.1 ParB/RepB/Spo0J family partition protein [Turicibacter sanguinis]MDB8569561.1 ParB/RepB/Spo0J family partition protein [Turicibacter sanguinis]MDB8572312.1 ParB/RepB/Spo0J family partition protein [Turicibacter sanguinis]